MHIKCPVGLVGIGNPDDITLTMQINVQVESVKFENITVKPVYPRLRPGRGRNPHFPLIKVGPVCQNTVKVSRIWSIPQVHKKNTNIENKAWITGKDFFCLLILAHLECSNSTCGHVFAFSGCYFVSSLCADWLNIFVYPFCCGVVMQT